MPSIRPRSLLMPTMTSSLLHASRRLLPARALTPLSPPPHTAIGNRLPLLLHPSPSLRTFSTTTPTCSAAQSDDHAHSQYDPPTGWLLGVPPGEKYQNEGWENSWIYGYWGTLLLATIAYIYKPDTS